MTISPDLGSKGKSPHPSRRRAGRGQRSVALLLLLLGCLPGTLTHAAVVWQQGFEGSANDWTIPDEPKVWEIGAPTFANGPQPHSGSGVAGTILAGNYVNNNGATLVSPVFTVPLSRDFPRLRYWDWHDTDPQDGGAVQISVNGGGWQELGMSSSGDFGRKWSQRIVDLRAFGGQSVRIRFFFYARNGSPAAGWYIDDVSIETGAMVFNNPEGFENGFGDWSVDHTVWEIGAPTFANGPQPHSGSGVAGTNLAGNYVNNNGASLVSPIFTVPLSSDFPRLRYWDWHDTDPQDSGAVQISVNGGGWQELGMSSSGDFGRKWSQRIVDLRAFGGQSVRIRFFFYARNGSPAAGWYIDDVSIETGAMVFNNPEGFENGFGDWSVDHTVWEIGAPAFANGPQPHSGSGVAGTILGDNYVNNNGASLFSPIFTVPLSSDFPRLRYWDWHDTDLQDSGAVQISVNGGGWQELGMSSSGDFGRKWSQRIVDLRAFGGQSVQIRFFFYARNGSPATGWYIDDVSIETGAMVFNNPEGFENGFGDWSVDHTVWEIGAPTFANGPQPHSGSGVAGTILAGNYVNNNGASLFSPRFMVPLAATNPRFSYWDWHDTDPQDSGVVQISVNGGGWQNLGLGTAASAANPREWNQQSVSLQPYAGQQVRLRFFFFARNGSPAAGWYIDDVQITSDSLDPIADQTIQEGTDFRLSAVAHGEGAVFRLGPNAPAGATIDTNAGVFRWTPEEDQGPAVFRGVTIEVTKPSGGITPLQRQAFNITVTEVNRAPTLSVPTAQISDEQVLWSQSVTATDPDLPANRITYSLVAPPFGMTINAQTGVLSWTPDESQGPTENVIVVVATDNGTPPLSITNVFDLTVREVNTAPSLDALADASVLIGAPFTLQASAIDTDLPANDLSFGLEGAPAGMVIDPATGRIAWTPSQAQVGEHSVVVRVVDDGSPVFQATRAFKVIVLASELRLALQPLAAGLMRIRISGDLGQSYDLQSSSNLVDWQRLAEFRLNSSPFSYIDPDSPDVPVRFYRVLLKGP